MSIWCRSLAGILWAIGLAACHTATRPSATPEQLDGVYKLDRSGQAGGGWRVRSTLTLTAPNHYELESIIRVRGEESEETESGRYFIRRGNVILTNARRDETELLIRGDSLVGKVDFPGAMLARLVGGPPVYVRTP